MFAVLKRELSAYFKSPIGYVFIAATFLFSGFFFWSFSLSQGSTDVSGVFQGMFYVYIIFVFFLFNTKILDYFANKITKKRDA